MRGLSLVEHFARAAGKTHLAAVVEEFVADPGGLARLRVEMGEVRDVDRQLFLDDAAGIAHARLRVTPRDMDALHDGARLGRIDPQYLARLALVAAADDDDVVALLDLQLRHGSEDLGGQRDDLHEAAGPQFARHRPEDAGADRLALAGDQHRRVAVEADRAAVDAADLLGGSDDDGAMHDALLDPAARDRLLDRNDDHVADARGLALRAAEHLDALHPPRAGIVGDIEIGLHLDHAAPPASSVAAALRGARRRRGAGAASSAGGGSGGGTGGAPGSTSTIQCLRFDSGRLSWIRTASPAW